MTEKEKYAMASMVYEAVRFALWAAGEGICPIAGENAVAPEDFLFEYSKAVDIEDWDGLHIAVRDVILSSITNGEQQ